MPVEVQFAGSQPNPFSAAEIESWAAAVMEWNRDSPAAVDVCIRVVDEAESRELNAGFRQQDKPTNVLSFPADVLIPQLAESMEEGIEKILGDILICDPVVRREAQAQEKSVHHHYAHMVVHGMLHLYGHDHVAAEEAGVMEDIEREILKRLGVADPYQTR